MILSFDPCFGEFSLQCSEITSGIMVGLSLARFYTGMMSMRPKSMIMLSLGLANNVLIFQVFLFSSVVHFHVLAQSLLG